MDVRILFDGTAMSGDLTRDGLGGLATDGGLETAVIISLFTDRRARPDDALPGAPDDRRGWWGDALPAVSGLQGDRIGSRLWLLGREKIVPETLRRARDYCREALAWMIEDKLAGHVDVQCFAEGNSLIAAIAITRLDGSTVSLRHDILWQGQEETAHAV